MALRTAAGSFRYKSIRGDAFRGRLLPGLRGMGETRAVSTFPLGSMANRTRRFAVPPGVAYTSLTSPYVPPRIAGGAPPKRAEPMSRRFWDIQLAAQALATGRILIVLDSEDRENEGDLLIAAEKATPEALYFMLRRACGQLCVPVAAEIASRLDLTPMTSRNTKLSATAFAVPVDHCSCRTGISPEERAATIQALLSPASRPEDFVRPGHVFPLIAREGGAAPAGAHRGGRGPGPAGRPGPGRRVMRGL